MMREVGHGREESVVERFGGSSTGQVHQDEEPGGPLDQDGDSRSAVLADDEVARPMARLDPVGDLGRPVIDQVGRSDDGAVARPVRMPLGSASLPTGALCMGCSAFQAVAAGSIDGAVERLDARWRWEWSRNCSVRAWLICSGLHRLCKQRQRHGSMIRALVVSGFSLPEAGTTVTTGGAPRPANVGAAVCLVL